MADGYDRFDNESGGGSFVMGLLTGTVLGAGLGMLFAPKAGSQLRNQISERAGSLANNATEGYRRASEAAGDLADRGRDMYDKARGAVTKGVEEAQRYARDAAGNLTNVASTAADTAASASTAGGMWSGAQGGADSRGDKNVEQMRGSSPEQTRGAAQNPGGSGSGSGSRRS
jgi:gas vesicle protein